MSRSLALVVAALLALAAAGCGDGPGRVDRVVVITLDTTRADRLGFHGYDGADTPSLDALAAGGVVFDEAVSPVPTTLAAHTSMFTGTYPPDHGIRYNLAFRLGDEADTLAERLRAAGFATAAFPASFVVSAQYGIDQGFDHFVDPPEAGGELHSIESMRSAEDGVDLVLEWLGRRGSGERAFVWLHMYDPHWPYTPKFPWGSTFADRPYDGEIAYVDRQVGRLVEALRADPAWSRTAVIVLGDHGEGLYDHREPFHAQLIYQTTQHVPFVVHAPGVPHRRVAEPVTIADLMPTVLDLAGEPVPDGLRGVSLVPALRGETPPARDLYMESLSGALNYGWAEVRGVRAGRYKLIEAAGTVELYDLADDPAELRDLGSIDVQRVADLQAALAALERTDEPTHAESALDSVPDPETQRMLESLGYAGGAVGGAADNAPHPRDVIELEAELLAAQSAIHQQDWRRLENVGRYVLERDPTNRFALSNLAQTLVRTGRPREGQDVAAEMVRVYPDFPGGYARLAEAYRAQDDLETAHRVLVRGIEATAATEGPQRSGLGQLEYYAALTAYEIDPGAACGDEIATAVAAESAPMAMYVLAARCAAGEGDAARAIDMLRRAVDGGFRSFERLAEEAEFESLAATDAFRDLAAGAADPDAS